MNSASPTRVSAAQFGWRQARFGREDSLFALFGLLIVTTAAGLRALRPARPDRLVNG